MSAIVLNTGQVVRGPIESNMIRPAKVIQYMPVDVIARKLRAYLDEWKKETAASGEDINTVAVSLLYVLDDIATICEIPPDQWPYLDE